MDENDEIEKNLETSRQKMVEFERNSRTLQYRQQFILSQRQKIYILNKIRRFYEEISRDTSSNIVLKIHFILFFIAFGIHILNLNLEKRKLNYSSI